MNEPEPSFAPEQLLEALGQAVIATDLDGTVVSWNATAERLYGWPASEVIGRNVVEITVPRMSQEMAAQVMASLRVGDAWSGGFTVQRRDGSVFPALVTDAGIFRGGELVGIVGVSTNLGSALWPLLERSSDAALVLSRDAVIRYASPAVGPLFGWQPDELLGQSFRTYVDERDHDELRRVLREPPTLPGPVIELRVHSALGVLTAEGSFTDLRDDPVVRGVVCNLRHSERLARLRERARISESAHADILQTLFSARLELASAQRALGADPEGRLDSAGAKIAEAIAALRALVEPDEETDGPEAWHASG